MSLVTALYARLLKHNRHDDAVESLTSARCYECGVRFWGATEQDAYQQLFSHAVLAHDVPPSTDPQPEDEENEEDVHTWFPSEVRDRLYGESR